MNGFFSKHNFFNYSCLFACEFVSIFQVVNVSVSISKGRFYSAHANLTRFCGLRFQRIVSWQLVRLASELASRFFF